MAEDRFSKEARELTLIAAVLYFSVNYEFQRTGVKEPLTADTALDVAFHLCERAEKKLAEDFDGHA